MDDLTALTLAARGGSPEALEAFVRAAQPDVWRFCAYLVSPHMADDLTQETFIRAVPAIDRYRGDAPARPWLLAIARHTCADFSRRSARQLSTVPLEVDHHRVDSGGEHELFDLIERLDTDRRVPFVLTQLLGFSYAEAAEACDCPIGTIRSRVTRARAQLIDDVLGSPEGQLRKAGEA